MNGIVALTADAYHADTVADRPSLSASIAKILCDRTPLHAWTAHPRLNPNFVREEKDAFDLGTIAHALILQGDTATEVLDFPDWRTKIAKEAREASRAAGKTPILAKHWSTVRRMVEAAVAQIDSHEADPALFAPGLPEQTIVWDEDGVTCRARIDWLHDDRRAIDDYKTTSASADPAAWCRTMLNMGGDIQQAFYRRGMRALFGQNPEWRFIVQETYPPYALSVVSLAPDALALAEKKVERAIETWRRCLATDTWPGYTTRIAYAESPPWAEAQYLEREAMEEEVAA